MGIRKGWALCGARKERCLISHAVSSHPLLELQTLGLSTLSSPHHQDLPLDSIQKNPSTPQTSFHPPLSACSFFFFFCPFFVFTLTSPATSYSHPDCFQKMGTLWWLISFITFFTFPEDEGEKKTWADSGNISGQRAHTSFPLPFFFLPFFYF